jgi:hypothetical protein
VDGRRKLSQAEIRRLQEAFASMWANRNAVNALSASKNESSHERLVNRLETHAEARALRKMVDVQMVYRPVEGCPCAYEPYLSF